MENEEKVEMRFMHDIERLEKLEKRQTTIVITFTCILVLFVSAIILFSFAVYKTIFNQEKIDELKSMQHAYAMSKINVINSEYKQIEFEIKLMIDGIRNTTRSCRKQVYPSKYRIDNILYIEQCATPIYIAMNVFGVDRFEIYSIIASESEGNIKSIGKIGSNEIAFGPMQIKKNTFGWIQSNLLFDYREKNINNVYDNVEAGITYWKYCKSQITQITGKVPTAEQLGWAYNAGLSKALEAITNNSTDCFVPETIYHGKKIMYYYTNYKAGNFDVWFYDDKVKK